MTSSIAKNETDETSRRARLILIVAVVTGLLTDAIGSILLSFARGDISGTLSITPDQFAMLVILYISSKITGYLLAPCFCASLGPRSALSAALTVLTCIFALMTLVDSWLLQLGLFAVLGLAGGTLLVSSQALLFLFFERKRQPVIQMLYALGSAAGAASLAPGLQGWLLYWTDWRWIATVAVVIGLLALVMLRMTSAAGGAISESGPMQPELVLFTWLSITCLAYVSTQGERWNWFESPRILLASLVGGGGILLSFLCLIRQKPQQRMLNLTVFGNLNFSFAFLASFAAGFALFGTGFLIPAYALGALGMSQLQIGQLLLPGWLSFALAMCLTAFALPRLRIPPVVTVPFGIILIMLAMWLLSQQARGASVAELMPAILLRSGALGFLFLSITLMALMGLKDPQIAHGSALMSAARQLGGLAGTGYLGALLVRKSEMNAQILSAQLNTGNPILSARISGLAAKFGEEGLNTGDATAAAVGHIVKALSIQANAVAWNHAFMTVVLFFICAAPILVLSRVVLARIIPKPE